MSTGNPLEQIRRRMQAHATPTAFAALAEEHRRAGRFDEAIAVCRDGLSRYPAYVSARVTLGRALLDSGDTAAALAELEQAVAQAPDNLAAARALESVHTALGNAPPPPLPIVDLPLHGGADIAPPAVRSVVAEALADGPDGPQEFGFGPDWSLPVVPATDPALPDLADDTVPIGIAPVDTHDARGVLQDSVEHSEAPTMLVAPPPLPGEEPAGIWPVPEVVVVDAPDAADGVPVHSWALDAPADSDEVDGSRAPGSTPVSTPDVSSDATPEVAPAWDAPTMEAPLAELFALAPLAEEAREEHSVVASVDRAAVEAAQASAGSGAADAEAGDSAPASDGLDDRTSPFWTGSFGGEPQAEPAAPFSGWGDDVPPAETAADRSPWAEEAAGEQSGPWNVPDGPSASWALDDLQEAEGADTTPFARVRDVEPDAEAQVPSPLADPPVAVPASVAERIEVAGAVIAAPCVAADPVQPDLAPPDLAPLDAALPDAASPDAAHPDATQPDPVRADGPQAAGPVDVTPPGVVEVEPAATAAKGADRAHVEPDAAGAEAFETQPEAADAPPLVDVAWAGSVKSALGEHLAQRRPQRVARAAG